MTQYATYTDFTEVYSIRGVEQSVIDGFLTQGSTMINERLGSKFTTPFSSNNRTAVELTRDMAMYMLQVRTIAPGDAEEIKVMLDNRIQALMDGAPMATSSGAILATTNINNTVYSTNQNYKRVFDMRTEEFQRVDPDLLTALDDQDNI